MLVVAQYDALLISMTQLPKNSVLRNGDMLTSIDYIFIDPQRCPELGNIIAFTDGVFDESLWQDRSWLYGYQFAKHRLDENDETLLVSRGSTLEEALKHPNFQFFKTDICDRAAIYAIFEAERPDAVVHFAAESHVDRSIEEPEVFLRTNVLGTQVLLDACLKYGTKRFHQAPSPQGHLTFPSASRSLRTKRRVS